MIELIQMCSPQMQLPVAQAIIKTESQFNPYAIGVNKGGKPVKQPKNYIEAVNQAKRLIASGANIDMGLSQINSSNLGWLNLSIEQVFNPCNNLKAMQTVYQHCFNRAGNTGLGTRMQRALSCYNTGNMKSGFKNGYVNKVTKHFNDFVASSTQQIRYNQYPQDTKYIPLPSYQNQQQNKQINQVQPVTVEAVKQVEQQTNLNTNSEPMNNEAPVHVQVFHSWDIFREF